MPTTTFGCDCEYVLTLNGQYKSAVSVLKGNREKRQSVKGSEFFHDNVLAEVAVKYGRTAEEVVSNTRSALHTLKKLVSPCVIHLSASADYPAKELSHPDARDVGCSEETDAYSHRTLPSREKAIKTTSFRTAGGHIHLGGNDGPLQNSIEIPLVVYALDLFVGLPSLFLDNCPLSKERRKMYGRAGSYREKGYGLEYRVLGPFWHRSPETVKLIYDLSQFAVDFVAKRMMYRYWEVNEAKLLAGQISEAYRCIGYDTNELVIAINNHDTKTAETFLLLLEQLLPPKLMADFMRERAATHDFYEAWALA